MPNNPIPPLEDRVQQIIVEARLTTENVETMWGVFEHYDKGASGQITQDQFHKIIGDEELLFFFGMCLFDLVGARNYKALNFSDFVYGMVTFSLFGTEELLRFSFNCFDPERNGIIDLSDFDMMSRLLHARSSVIHNVTSLTSNVQTVLQRMDAWVQEDLRIDYDEFVETNKMYPWILKPAEKFRRKVRNVTFGDDWWRDRITMLHWERQARMDVLKGAEARKNRWEASRQNRMDVRKIRRRMGNPLFYLCPLLRPIFTMQCWDPQRKANKLRGDAIKQRLANRYEATVIEVVPAKEVKHVPKKPQPRVEDKVDAREKKKEARRAAKAGGKKGAADGAGGGGGGGGGGSGGLTREERAARSKEKRNKKNAEKAAEKGIDTDKKKKKKGKSAKI